MFQLKNIVEKKSRIVRSDVAGWAAARDVRKHISTPIIEKDRIRIFYQVCDFIQESSIDGLYYIR
jgi:hypothetical protein